MYGDSGWVVRKERKRDIEPQTYKKGPLHKQTHIYTQRSNQQICYELLLNQNPLLRCTKFHFFYFFRFLVKRHIFLFCLFLFILTRGDSWCLLFSFSQLHVYLDGSSTARSFPRPFFHFTAMYFKLQILP